MSAGIASATIRVTVVGDAGRADLAVPLWVDVESLARSFAETVGTDPPRLSSTSGVLLDSTSSVEQAGLRHGDVLVALAPDAEATLVDEGPPVASGPRPVGARAQSLLLALAAACGLGGAAALALGGGSGAARTVCLVVLLLCATVAAFPIGGASGASARARTAASPAFAAGAGFAATYTDGPGGLLLGLAVGALAASVFAAVCRTFLDPEHDELAAVWLVVGGVVAVVVTVLLLVGAAPQALWAVLFAAAVVAARLLPYTVVDVPDEALLDLDRLAVTAWSARERPRTGRRRSMVRIEGVTTVVHRGLRLVAAGTFVIAGTVAVTGPLLVLDAGHDRQGIGSLVMVGLGGIGLSLVARSFRSAVPRVALRVAATWLLGLLGYVVLREFGSTTDWVVFASASGLALLVTVAAVSLGHGWRSVWWARVADIVEGLSIVLVVAAAPLASGFFDVVRGFTA